MAYKILHRHGNAAPGGKASYIKLGTFGTKIAAKRFAKTKLSGEGYLNVPSSKVKHTGRRWLYYVRK